MVLHQLKNPEPYNRKVKVALRTIRCVLYRDTEVLHTKLHGLYSRNNYYWIQIFEFKEYFLDNGSGIR